MSVLISVMSAAAWFANTIASNGSGASASSAGWWSVTLRPTTVFATAIASRRCSASTVTCDVDAVDALRGVGQRDDVRRDGNDDRQALEVRLERVRDRRRDRVLRVAAADADDERAARDADDALPSAVAGAGRGDRLDVRDAGRLGDGHANTFGPCRGSAPVSKALRHMSASSVDWPNSASLCTASATS
jgi:hypothetical protein